jgi:hypothetical protein
MSKFVQVVPSTSQRITAIETSSGNGEEKLSLFPRENSNKSRTSLYMTKRKRKKTVLKDLTGKSIKTQNFLKKSQDKE